MRAIVIVPVIVRGRRISSSGSILGIEIIYHVYLHLDLPCHLLHDAFVLSVRLQ